LEQSSTSFFVCALGSRLKSVLNSVFIRVLLPMPVSPMHKMLKANLDKKEDEY
jgi:hypothetical protein